MSGLANLSKEEGMQSNLTDCLMDKNPDQAQPIFGYN